MPALRSHAALAIALLAACAAPEKSGGLDPEPVLERVVITPANVALAAGDSFDFAAVAEYSDGSSGSVPVSWASTGGTVTGAGVYHAGVAAGSFMVIVVTADFLHADTAVVSIAGAGGPSLAGLSVQPASLTLDPGATAGFSAVGSFSDGSNAAVVASWNATGGSVTQGGSYHAGAAAGAFRVIASHLGFTDTALVTIRDTTTPAPTLTAVTVTPAAVTVDPGSTTAFSATGSYSDGSSGAVGASWTATGGTVSQGGSYQAGATAGSFRVVAGYQGHADTALVSIRDTTTPGGGTVLLTEGFDDASVSGRGWYDNTNPAVVATGQHGGAGALQMAWATGSTTPAKGAAVRHLFTATDRIYVSYWVKYSTNWIGSGVNYHPHEFHVITDQDGAFVGPSATHLTTYIEQNYQNGGVPRLSIQDALNIDVTKLNVNLTGVTENRAVSGCNGSTDGYPDSCYQSGTQWRNEKIWKAAAPAFLPNPGPGYKGDWHRVEAYFQLNTIQGGKGVADGIAQYWFDGQLLIDHQNVVFRTAQHPTMKFNQFVIAPYIGTGSTVAQTMWIDDVVLATARVP
ncbi:MAG: hypothetical protein IPI92_15225 [Gemmatimonadetes bacterium]|nr:hypothetical protein [Gemmatimonadota bacterium]MBK7351206.1 hypothetical protein [Gemmatimonadota bacterium]MBK7786366.1 hypothetical protein [Gemmatimonadota bacterium]